jgi:hypothetical protein
MSVCANDENACEKCKPMHAQPETGAFRADHERDMQDDPEYAEAFHEEADDIEPGSEKDLYPDGTKWRVVPNRRDRRRLGFRNRPRQFRTTSPRRNPLILGNVRRSKFIKAWEKLNGTDE